MFKEYYSVLNSVHLMTLNTDRIGYLIKNISTESTTTIQLYTYMVQSETNDSFFSFHAIYQLDM
jgi:hypothetical protein